MSSDSGSLKLHWGSFWLKGRCLLWHKMAAMVGSVYCHLAVPAPSKGTVRSQRKALSKTQTVQKHPHTHTLPPTQAHLCKQMHTWGKTCTWTLWNTHKQACRPQQVGSGMFWIHPPVSEGACYPSVKKLIHSSALFSTQFLKYTPENLPIVRVKLNCAIGNHQVTC